MRATNPRRVLSSGPMRIHVLDHPLLQETMARLRDRDRKSVV